MQHVSSVLFVDCPGHDILLVKTLNVAAVMDAPLLLIAVNENVQLSGELTAVGVMK